MDEKRLARKRQQWVDRTMAVCGLEEAETIRLLSTERRPSFRVNSLRAPDAKVVLRQLIELGWRGEALGAGFTIEEGYKAVRDSEFAKEGGIYIQNAASWLPVQALDPRPSERILDMCAAPGGKAAHIAALTNNQAELWVNDNSRARLHKMRANFARLGVAPAEETMYDATQLARKLMASHPELTLLPHPGRSRRILLEQKSASFYRQNGSENSSGMFDKILLDAPCSGEGLMNYNSDKDFSTWSIAHVKRLQQLQKKLLVQAWQLLKPGGTLVYSTCTMAPEENEAVVDYLLRHNFDAQVKPIEAKMPNAVKPVTTWQSKNYSLELEKALRLLPSEHVEAFFVCRIDKVGKEEYKLTS